MQIKPLDFRDFKSGIAIIREQPKPFLPGGRRRSEAPPPPPPIFNEEQLKTAEREAYKKGFLEGTAEGRKLQDSEQAANDRKLLQGLETLLKNSSPVFTDYRTTITKASESLPKAALAIARKVADGALAENTAGAVESTALRCVEIMLGEPKLVVTVHESLAGALKQKIEALTKTVQTASDVIVNGDAAIAITDYRVEWKNGALVRNTEKLWEEITRVVDGLSASARHEAETRATALQSDPPAPAQANGENATKKE